MKASDSFLVNEAELAELETPFREHYLPIRKADLVRVLADREDLSEPQQERFLQLCRLLDATFHYEYHARLEDLKNSYAFFNPDADVEPQEPLDETQRGELAETLVEKVVHLLERANFRRLTQEDIESALNATSEWGVRLHVDFDVFQQLEVYSRGDRTATRQRRNWKTLYRAVEVEVPIYQRLVVIFRLREHKRIGKDVDTNAIYVKIFKDIPKQDLDMLLPGTQIRMSLADRGKILFPTISGAVVTITKVLKTTILATMFSGFWGLITFFTFLAGAIGYAAKSVFGYFQTQNNYQLSLTRHLYYQNLDNNAGVLFHLLNEAEDQEVREAILGYYLLWRFAGKQGWTDEQLDKRADEILTDWAGIDGDFEVHDAVEKLLRLGIALRLPNNRLVAIPIDDALHRLDDAWDNYFHFGRCCGEGDAPAADST